MVKSNQGNYFEIAKPFRKPTIKLQILSYLIFDKLKIFTYCTDISLRFLRISMLLLYQCIRVIIYQSRYLHCRRKNI